MTMKKNYNRTGFTRFEALVVVGVIGLILLAVLPALRKPQRRASQINCINNVKQVVLSSRMWANDHEDRMPAQVPTYEGGAKEFVGVGKAFLQFQVMSNELSTPKILLCTEEKRRTWATNFSNLSDSNISFFAAPDAVLSQPDHWLTGHRNLATNKVALIPSEFAMPPTGR
jgi:competence protein ComGC